MPLSVCTNLNTNTNTNTGMGMGMRGASALPDLDPVSGGDNVMKKPRLGSRSGSGFGPGARSNSWSGNTGYIWTSTRSLSLSRSLSENANANASLSARPVSVSGGSRKDGSQVGARAVTSRRARGSRWRV
jgi:hypothetical protein